MQGIPSDGKVGTPSIIVHPPKPKPIYPPPLKDRHPPPPDTLVNALQDVVHKDHKEDKE
jgi:hypothetical protein